MRFFYAGGKVVISWKYHQNKNGTITTECILRDCLSDKQPGELDPEYYGYAQQHKGDFFSKETGRKRSLAQALKAAGFTREDRALIWPLYFLRGDQHRTDYEI